MELDLSRFPGRVIATRSIAPRPATVAPLPTGLHPALRDALAGRGIWQSTLRFRVRSTSATLTADRR